jgi:hypothetical protein
MLMLSIVGYEYAVDGVADRRHFLVQLRLHPHGNLRLAAVDLVELHAGDVAEQDIVDDGLHLALGVGHGVDGFEYLERADGILDRNRDGDEDVVLGLGLHFEIDLLDLERDLELALDERQLEVQPGMADTVEFAEALNDRRIAGLHRERHASQNYQHKKNKNPE